MLRSSRSFGASLAPLSMNPGTSPKWEILRLASRIIFICLLAALFAHWLTSAEGRRNAGWGRPQASNCESFGRGGAFCAPGATEDPAPAANSDSMRECQSLGRGGLVCPRTSER